MALVRTFASSSPRPRIQEDEDQGDCVLLGRFPIDQAFDFSETIATGFGIFQYNMTVDNTKDEDNA